MSEEKKAVVVAGQGAAAMSAMVNVGPQAMAEGETAGSILAAQATAMVRARVFLAKMYPRDWNQVRDRLKAAIERPGFAGNKNETLWGAGWYRKPITKTTGVEGFSIRFAEEAARHLGNLDIQQDVVFENDEQRIVKVNVIDLESNNSWPTSVPITKTRERNGYKRDDDEVIRTRTNSKGEKVFVVRATEDEVYMKQQRMVAFAIRNGILRLVPGDILGECRARILQIREGAMAEDPDAEKKKILDGFSKLKVQPKDLKDLLGHDVDKCTAAELVDLRDLWEDLRDGKVVWAEVLAEVKAERGETPAPAAPDPLQAVINGAPAAAPADTPAQPAMAPAAVPALTPEAARAELGRLVETVKKEDGKLWGRKKKPEKPDAPPPCSKCGRALEPGERTYADAEGRAYCGDCGKDL